MRCHDTTADFDCAARSGGALVAAALWRVALLRPKGTSCGRNPGAMIRTQYVSD